MIPSLKDVETVVNVAEKINRFKNTTTRWFYKKNKALELDDQRPCNLSVQQLNELFGCFNQEIIDRITLQDPDKYHKIADSCQRAMSILLSQDSHKLHCSIKRFVDKERIYAIGRSSENKVRRMVEHIGEENSCKVTQNSAYSAILGKTDEVGNDWHSITGGAEAFIAGNLDKRPNYACSRNNWHQSYLSVAVFPMYLPHNQDKVIKRDGKDSLVLGFLTFDSLDPDIFLGLPDIFDNLSKMNEYEHGLAASPVFNHASTMAYLIGNSLRYGSNS